MSHAETDRLHAFDNVRGLAAAAVVALHASYAYARFPLAGLVWPVPLDEPSAVANAVFWGIEGSVMPLFFTLSGFFLARSLAKQSAGRVLAGRTRRLLVPMTTVGLAVLAVDLHVWVLGLITTDRATIREYRRLKFAPDIQSDLFGPAHLWYIEYLWLLCVAICAAFWLVNRLQRRRTFRANVLSRTTTACGLASLAAAACVLLTLAPQIVLGFQHGWLPDVAKFAHAAVFLLFGLLLQQSPWLIGTLRRAAAYSAVAALGLFAAMLPRLSHMMQTEQTGIDLVFGSLLAAFAIAVTFGTIGVGLRWLDRPIAPLSRLAAASLWIYLVHHPLVGLLQIAMREVTLPPVVKCIAAFAIAIVLSLWSYERFASRGVLARLLDGEWPWQAFRAPTRAEAPIERPSRRAA